VYALKSVFRKYIYVGLSTNVPKRVQRHEEGRERTTKPYRPFELVLVEEFETRAAAREREKYLKSGSGKEFLKRISEAKEFKSRPEK
jgi:putative endonuclease